MNIGIIKTNLYIRIKFEGSVWEDRLVRVSRGEESSEGSLEGEGRQLGEGE